MNYKYSMDIVYVTHIICCKKCYVLWAGGLYLQNKTLYLVSCMEYLFTIYFYVDLQNLKTMFITMRVKYVCYAELSHIIAL